MLNKGGAVTGFCVPTGADECFSLTGASVATPAHMTSAINSSYVWNGTAVVIGPRVYVPSGNGNTVGCYDFSATAGCANFPKTFSNLYLLYTVNPDPYRGDCLWVNADSGTQIQNFDAFNPSQACGQGPDPRPRLERCRGHSALPARDVHEPAGDGSAAEQLLVGNGPLRGRGRRTRSPTFPICRSTRPERSVWPDCS